MDRQNIQSIFSKDFTIFRKKKYIVYSAIILPLIASVGFPLILSFAISKGVNIILLKSLILYFSFFFVILSGLAPAIIAGYSLVGEKIEKSLEPLLATPMTDKEILLGKSISSFIPILATMYICGSIFTILVDIFTEPTFGYYYLPNWTLIEIMILVVPATILFSVEGSIIISSRVNDIRTANQFGIVLMLPFIAIYILSEAQVITLDNQILFLIALTLFIVDIFLFYISTLLFNREEILTKWK
ncbi:MAG: ABC transporter permease subunit [Candidatus Thorarchaeota archaeon]